jgi:hypothetical protein
LLFRNNFESEDLFDGEVNPRKWPERASASFTLRGECIKTNSYIDAGKLLNYNVVRRSTPVGVGWHRLCCIAVSIRDLGIEIKKDILMKLRLMTVALAVLAGTSASVNAIDYSFTGNIAQDNTVLFFNFTVGAASPDVVLRTWSYAGGVNAAGATIASGGFDPILAVFDSAGTLINQNDDGGSSVPADSVTGAHFDTYLDLGALTAGNYTVSVMQYNNFATGPTLANGFSHGNGTPAEAWFTQTLTGNATGGFWDVTIHQRDSHWAFDILGVQQAIGPDPSVPDCGATVGLLGLALGGLALIRNRVRK